MRQLDWFYDISDRAWRVINVDVPGDEPEPLADWELELLDEGPNPGIAWSEDERQHAREWAVVHGDR